MLWEYLLVTTNESGMVVNENGITTERTGKQFLFPDYANQLGLESWELVSAAVSQERRTVLCFFKRKLNGLGEC